MLSGVNLTNNGTLTVQLLPSLITSPQDPLQTTPHSDMIIVSSADHGDVTDILSDLMKKVEDKMSLEVYICVMLFMGKDEDSGVITIHDVSCHGQSPLPCV